VFSKPPISYIDVRVFAHATEDEEKVLAAVRNTLPKELSENTVFQKTNLKGHHGNPITLFETKLKDKKALPTALVKVGDELSELDKQELGRDIKLHLEKQNLYLRFDKQSAYQSKLRFSKNDPIRFKIHFRNKTFEEILEICKNAGLLP
jgi:RNA binding exosome subunit